MQFRANPFMHLWAPSLLAIFLQEALTTNSPPRPARQASHPSMYVSLPVLPLSASGGVLTTNISPIDTPATFLALRPVNIRPSSP